MAARGSLFPLYQPRTHHAISRLLSSSWCLLVGRRKEVEEDVGEAVGRRGRGASPGYRTREAPQGHHIPPARHRQRCGRRCRCREQLQAGAVYADDPDHAGDAVVVDHAARRRQRVAQRVPPGEQPGDQGRGRQHLRPPAAQLPHRLRLALQRRDEEQPPLDRWGIRSDGDDGSPRGVVCWTVPVRLCLLVFVVI